MQIPDRPFAQLPTGRIDPTAQGRSGGTALFNELGRAGEKLFQAGLLIQEQRDHDALVEAQNEYQSTIGEWFTDAEQNRQGSAAGGFTKDFATRHAEAVGSIEERMKDRLSGNGRRAFKNWALSRETAGGLEAAQFEHRQLKLHGQDMHALRVQSIFEGIGKRPEAFADAAAQLEESYALAVGQGIYRPEEAKAHLYESREKLKATAFENLYAKNRGLAMRSMDELGLDESQKARAQKRFKADIKAEQAEFRAQRADQVRALSMAAADIDYLAAHTGDARQMRELAGQFAKLGENETAQKLQQRADIYENNAAAIKESRNMPLPELETEIRRLDGDLELAGQNGQADEHRKLAEERRLRYGVYEERKKALANDPAQAVAGEVEKALPQNAEEAGASALADLRLAAQENNGVPSASRRVLTNNEAAAMGEAWKNGDLETRLGMAEALKSYGAHSGQVAAEIGLTPSEQIVLLAAGRDPRLAGNLGAVINAANSKIGDLPSVEMAEALTREAVEGSEVIRGYRAAAAVLSNNADLQGMVRNYQDTLGKLVRMENGDSAKARKTLDGNFLALTDKNYALVYDPGLYAEPADLEVGLAGALNGKALEALADNRNFASEYEKRDWLAMTRRTGVWLNAPDGDGYVLFDPVAKAPVMDKDRNILKLRDADLYGAARNTVRTNVGYWDVYSDVPQ